MKVRHVEPADAAGVAEIYNHYILNSRATFELDPITNLEMRSRIEESVSNGYPFLICDDEGEVSGYTYARQFRPRPAYKHSLETSVYVKPGFDGRGIGTQLYTALFEEIRRGDFHSVIAGISLPNESSVRLHEKFGFEKVAHFREVGFKFGKWVDVGYWQQIL